MYITKVVIIVILRVKQHYTLYYHAKIIIEVLCKQTHVSHFCQIHSVIIVTMLCENQSFSK